MTEGTTERRRRVPSMAAAIRQAERAGKAVSSATVRPDGSVSLTFANGIAPPSLANPWDEVLQHDAD
jgi:hypothetical protein